MTGVNISITTLERGEFLQCLLKKEQISGDGWLFSRRGATAIMMLSWATELIMSAFCKMKKEKINK